MKNKRYDFEQFNIYEIEKEYEPSEDIFTDDEYDVRLLKTIVKNLDETEKRIILSYAEIGNMRDTAKLFHISTTTLFWKLKDIKEKVLDVYLKTKKNEYNI